MTNTRSQTRSRTKATTIKSAGASPEKTPQKFDGSPATVSPTRSTRNRNRETASKTQATVQKNKKGNSPGTEMSPEIRTNEKRRSSRDKQLPVKRDRPGYTMPSEDLQLCRRLSEDLDEILSPEKSAILVKRQKLDGQPFDLKISRHERLTSSQSKRLHGLELHKQSRSSGACVENENMELQQASDKKSCRSNQQTRNVISVFEQAMTFREERNSLHIPKEQDSILGSQLSESNSHDIDRQAKSFICQDYLAQNVFATEKFDLPRGRVVRQDSRKSSPSHGFRKTDSPEPISPIPFVTEFDEERSHGPGQLSPDKVGRKYLQPLQGTDQPPAFDPSQDYFKLYWQLYLKNENLLQEIDQIATVNYKTSRKIFNLKDFYENTLIPQMLTQPYKFLHRLRQQQHQQRLLKEAKERKVKGQGRKGKVEACKDEKAALPKTKRKKHLRRTASEIDRAFVCPYDGCGKFFGSEGSQNLHIKIKHNGGSKTDRERLAKNLAMAYANNRMTNELIDAVELNLPPGVITKMAEKAGLGERVNEVELLDMINLRLAPKFREMVCRQASEQKRKGAKKADQAAVA